MNEQPSVHALAFRVMRLSKPSLHVQAAPLKVDLTHDMRGDDSASSVTSHTHSGEGVGEGPGPVPYAERVRLGEPVQLMGLNSLLELPQSFGTIYLGESFSSYISVGNYSDEEVTSVGVKAELESDRQKIVLYDNTASPLPSMAPGARHDFVVKHDIKELGPHTLVCSTVYTSSTGERKYMPQYFKFASSNPLSVRTKTRSVLDTVFLEACLENSTKAPLWLEYVKMEAAPGMKAEPVDVRESNLLKSAVNGPLSDYVSGLQVIGPSGGSLNVLFRVRREVRPAGAKSGQVGNALGKIELKWRGPMGEVGRLQTQQIMGVPDARKEVALQVLDIPEQLQLGVPFTLRLCVRSNVDRRVGPLFVGASPAVGLEGRAGPHAPAVIMHGPDNLAVGELDAYEEVTVNLLLVALRHGVQRVAGIQLFDSREVKVYDSLQGVEMYVNLTAPTTCAA